MKNEKLTEVIVEHIIANLGILGGTTASIMQDSFLTNKVITYIPSGAKELSAQVFAAETTVSSKKFSLICTKLKTSDKKYASEEIITLSKLEGAPSYGCYLHRWDDGVNGEALIGTELQPGNWIPTVPFLQATYLAGMEQIKDMATQYTICSNVDELFISLQQFISFEETHFEALYEDEEENK